MSYKKKKIIALIPARGGSKGIPRKNLKSLNGLPLIAYTIKDSLNSRLLDEVYVSTEDKEIKEISQKYGAKVIDRPSNLSSDASSTESVMLHAASYLENDFDFMVLLQCTSPLRGENDIDLAIKKIIDGKKDSLLSGYRNDHFLWDNKGNPINYDYAKRPRRQEKEWEFVENGSIYITSKKALLKEKCRLGGRIGQHLMPKLTSFEIDEESDFRLAEFMMREKTKLNLSKTAGKIKAIIFDFDGVFTDGLVYLDEEGSETMKFSRLDGKGIELARKAGLITAVISSENSMIALQRIKKLKIDEAFLGEKNKIKSYNRIMKKYKLKDDEICFCGDDVQDMEVMDRSGLSCAPSNAVDEVKKISKYVSSFQGGSGFVRDVCNLLLNSKKRGMPQSIS